MAKHCEVTGELESQCECGSHEDDEQDPVPLRIPFQAPPKPYPGDAA